MCRGTARGAQGKLQEAISDYRHVLSLEPNNRCASCNLHGSDCPSLTALVYPVACKLPDSVRPGASLLDILLKAAHPLLQLKLALYSSACEGAVLLIAHSTCSAACVTSAMIYALVCQAAQDFWDQIVAQF